jgi:hypothetical protein
MKRCGRDEVSRDDAKPRAACQSCRDSGLGCKHSLIDNVMDTLSRLSKDKNNE